MPTRRPSIVCPHCGKPVVPVSSKPYAGFLSEYHDEIIRRFDAGESTREIATWLFSKGARSGHKWDQAEGLGGSIRWILKKSGRELQPPISPFEERNKLIYSQSQAAGATQKAIAQMHSLSPERVSQIIVKMRNRLRREQLHREQRAR